MICKNFFFQKKLKENLSNKIGGRRTIKKKSVNPALKSVRTREKPAYFKNIPARTPFNS